MLYQTWAHNLFPKSTFRDFILQAEAKCKSDKQIKVQRDLALTFILRSETTGSQSKHISPKHALPALNTIGINERLEGCLLG